MTTFQNEAVLDSHDPTVRADYEAALDRIRAAGPSEHPLVIGEQRISQRDGFDSTNPANPAEVIGRHVIATDADVDMAIASAEAAFETWSRRPAQERIAIIRRAANLVMDRRQELNALMGLEVGKTLEEADGETAETVDLMRWYAARMESLAEARTLTPLDGEATEYYYVPLGVGVIIPPWNFPLALTAGMATAAIVAGNSIVIKPASNSATSVARLVQILIEGGVPAGVVNYVSGPGGTVGEALVDHPRTRFVAFTGSMDVGLRINERAAVLRPGQVWIKRIQLEMGGKNAVVVDETADIDAAAEAIVASAVGFQGQKCSAGSRAIVVDEVADAVVERVVERAGRLITGDPTGSDVIVGPLIDEVAQRKAQDYIQVGRSEGSVAFEGSEVPSKGWFVAPTIFSDVAPDARIAQEEIFGPVLTIIRAADFDDAMRIANGTRFGLTGSLFSRDRTRIESAKRDFHVGNLYINRKSTGALMGVHPFGGFNMSGTDSKAGGPDYLLFFLQGKSLGEVIDPSIE
jgi:1-pyrroline-5-carboxylate dehydrogenase